MADINLYLEDPKKVIGEYTEFFAGQLPTATDFNRWLAVLIAQGDYNTAWLDLVAQKAGISINELYEELSILSEIVTPGSGTLFSQRLATIETNAGGWINYQHLTSINPSFNLSTTTMYQIISAMANNSNLNVTLNNIHATLNADIPSNLGGVLDIKKTMFSATQGRAVLRYTVYNGGTWERVCSVTDDINTMTGWYELVNSNELGTWVDIESEITKLPEGASITIEYALYNPATKEVRMSISGNATSVPDGYGILQVPTVYAPTSQVLIHNAASAKRGANLTTNDYVNGSVIAGGVISLSFDLAIALYYLRANFSYIVR